MTISGTYGTTVELSVSFWAVEMTSAISSCRLDGLPLSLSSPSLCPDWEFQQPVEWTFSSVPILASKPAWVVWTSAESVYFIEHIAWNAWYGTFDLLIREEEESKHTMADWHSLAKHVPASPESTLGT